MTETTLANSNLDKRRWLNLILQILAGAAVMLVYMGHVWMIPLNEAYNWDMKIISLQFTLISVTGIFANIIGGRLRKKWGDRKLVLVSGIGFGVSIMICSISLSVWFFVLGAGVMASFFLFFLNVAQTENISELFPDRNGFALGLMFFGWEGLSSFLAPIAAGLMDIFGISMSFIIQGIGYGGLIILVSRLLVAAPDKYRPQGWEPDVLEAVGEETEGKSVDEIDRKTNWKSIILSPGYWILSITLLFALSVPLGISSNYTYLSVESLGVSTDTAAWHFVLYSIVMGAGSIIMGILADVFGIMRSFAITSFVLAIGFLVVVLVAPGSVGVFLIVMMVAGFIVGAFRTLLAVVLMAGWGEENYGLTMGVFGIFGALMNFVGPQMSVRMDVDNFFIAGGVLGIAGAVLSIFVTRIINRQIGYKVLK